MFREEARHNDASEILSLYVSSELNLPHTCGWCGCLLGALLSLFHIKASTIVTGLPRYIEKLKCRRASSRNQNR